MRLDHTGDGAFKNVIGVGLSAYFRFLAYVDEWDIFFDDLDQDANGLDLMEGKNAA
jgi:hypothetical protein